jgi:mannosyltransferase OCH1-like enzyme
MPAPFVEWGRSWAIQHPEWLLKTWTEDNVPPLTNGDLLPKCYCLAQQSDLVRYEILKLYGGVYIDTDLECLKPINELIKDLDFFGAWKRSDRMSNALFGGVPGHPIFIDLVSKFRENFSNEQLSAMGPSYFRMIVESHPGQKIFGEHTFQALLQREYVARGRAEGFPVKVKDPRPESYVVNHHSSQWFPPSNARLL